MSSPISPILADIMMQDLEQNVINSLDFNVYTYYRYVDDTFLIIPKDKIDYVLDKFNAYHPRLKFSHETENNNSIPFINFKIIRDNDGTIFTDWYRKDTYSGRFINFLSNHPKTQKAAIIKSSIDSATLLSHPSFHENNLATIKKLLLSNNYPLNFINYHIYNRISYNLNKINNICNNNTDNNK